MTESPSLAELEAAHCWEPGDRVPGKPEMTAFRQRLRLHQARWREANGHPMGTQPLVPLKGKPSRPVGSRLPFDYARDSGANFVTPAAREAARVRTSMIEHHQSFDHQRLWADLLWAPAIPYNLFGDLASDLRLADGAVHAWWPDTPGRVAEVRFAHSPGRLDRAFLGNLVEFDAAFVLDLEDGTHGIVGVVTKYHDRVEPRDPKPERLPRYKEVAKRSRVFEARSLPFDERRHRLLSMWLEHMLALSMLQHPDFDWTWGRLVYVYPAGNSDFAEACASYRELLTDRSSFTSMTMEELLGAGVLPKASVKALRERYVPSRARR
jgi:hypothetical protein